MSEKKSDDEIGEFEHGFPKHPVEIIQQTKSGTIRIPKEIRDEFPEEKPSFAFWREGDRFFFHYVPESELDKLNIEGEESSSTSKGQKSLSESVNAASGQKSGVNKTKKIEPELTKYFPYKVENQGKIAQVFETTFYKLIEDNPNVQEAIERMKYIMAKFTTGDSTNDSRLMISIINLIFDTIVKVQKEEYNQLLSFIDENVINKITSNFLLESGQIKTFAAAVMLNNLDYAEQILIEILDRMREYTEIYEVIQGYKNLVNSITGFSFKLDIPEDIKNMILDEMKNFIFGNEIVLETGLTVEEQKQLAKENPEQGFEGGVGRDIKNMETVQYLELDTDGALRFLDLLEKLDLKKPAAKIAGELLSEIPEEDPHLEEMENKKKHLEE